MGFQIWRSWDAPAFLLPRNWEYVLLAFYTLLAVFLLWFRREEFKDLIWRRIPLFLVAVAAPFVVSRVLVLTFPNPRLLPPPNIPSRPPPTISFLLGALPIFVAATWLGAGPALIVGLVSGLLRVGMTSGVLTEVFVPAFLGFILGLLIRQDYRGTLSSLARQPLFAAIATLVLVAPLLVVSTFAHAASSGLSGLDYALTWTKANLPTIALEVLIAGALIQAVYLVVPSWRPVGAAYRSPPYARSLNRRILFLFVPLITVMTLVLLYAVVTATINVATSEAVEEMARNANSAAEDAVYFIQTGQGLLGNFAADERLVQQDDPTAVESHLREALHTIAFFDQLMLVDEEGSLIAAYPPSNPSPLTGLEDTLSDRVQGNGAPQVSPVHRAPGDAPIISFMAPVNLETSQAAAEDGENERQFGALIGRTDLSVNPILNRIVSSLNWTQAEGQDAEGFIINEEGRVVAHTDPNVILNDQVIEQDPSRASSVFRGYYYERPNPKDNTREIVYYLPVEGYPWTIVIRFPYRVVLQQAMRIATPLLILQFLLSAGLIIVVPLLTHWLTQPLKRLATAADRIAEGDLNRRVDISGDDEVARVGQAFEDMRVRLKDRLDDLSLLLDISQAVSATLELSEGMPFVLEGVLQATEAKVARILLLSEEAAPQMLMSHGETEDELTDLDLALAEAVSSRTNPLLIENLARAKSLISPEIATGDIEAVIALPVRTKETTSAMIWVGYDHPHTYTDSEVDLLSTLTSQTAVLVENARLFEAAEGGRRRLAAILRSTKDAVLVIDQENQVLLINPAAAQTFGISQSAVTGERIDETPLASLLEPILEKVPKEESLTTELPLPDGRTLYASGSTIMSGEGERMGLVVVMSDITHLKELDEMKTEFVATVSHDLRAPLTFIRGYATMLPMIGNLNEKQRDYVNKILQGIGQMSELIDDLLDLGRIEAGVGLEKKPCHLGTILVEVVEGMRARAAAKGLTLRLDPSERIAVVAGDAALLRQAIANLVDNAIKYTPSGGLVTVGMSMRNGEAVIHVSDTGIGIAPDDQTRLFEKFYRIKRRDNDEVPGTGLGLALVKSITERHGGRVWVDSELNKGSTFYIGIPLNTANHRVTGEERAR